MLTNINTFMNRIDFGKDYNVLSVFEIFVPDYKDNKGKLNFLLYVQVEIRICLNVLPLQWALRRCANELQVPSSANTQLSMYLSYFMATDNH